MKIPARSFVPTALLIILVSICAQAQTAAHNGAAHIIVTVEGKKGAVTQLRQGDVMIHQGHVRVPVTELTPLSDQPLELYLAIDDTAGPHFATYLPDLRKFITTLPANVAVGVSYMHEGTIDIRQKPTTDHAAAARSLRLPLPNLGSSPYESIVELLKEWPQSNARHEIVMISNGFEPFGTEELSNPLVEEAIAACQREVVPVFAIYILPSGHWGHTFWRTTWGETYLSRLADETGGEGYDMTGTYQVSFAPYLDDVTQRLQNQYRVVFTPNPPPQPGFVPILVTTEVPDTDLVSQDRVWIGQ